jgi:hypothetical protein
MSKEQDYSGGNNYIRMLVQGGSLLVLILVLYGGYDLGKMALNMIEPYLERVTASVEKLNTTMVMHSTETRENQIRLMDSNIEDSKQRDKLIDIQSGIYDILKSSEVVIHKFEEKPLKHHD